MGAYDDTIAAALSTIDDVAGVDVTYRRGDLALGIKATRGDSSRRTEGVEVPIDASAATWLIRVAQLTLNGEPLTPQEGDLVEQTIGAAVVVFEVTTDGENVWTWSDRARTRYRVHTKEKPTG